jgi:hypothetical protein
MSSLRQFLLVNITKFHSAAESLNVIPLQIIFGNVIPRAFCVPYTRKHAHLRFEVFKTVNTYTVVWSS